MTANISRGKASNAVVRQRLFDFLDAQDEARKAGRKWSGCVVPCHSRKYACGIESEIRDRYGADGPTTKLYTAETDQKEKGRDFKDATTSWDGTRAVVYTGTVSVGISATTAHITHAFAFFTSGNAGTAQSAQMIFRARELKHIEIAYDGRSVFGLPVVPTKLFEWVTLAKNRSKIPDQFRSDCAINIDEPTETDPEALGRLVNNSFEGAAWVCDMVDRNRSARWFVPRLVRLLDESGCVVTNTLVGDTVETAAETTSVSSDSLKKTQATAEEAQSKANRERDEIAAREFIPAMAEFIDSVEQSGDGADDTRLLTANEIQGRRAVHAGRTYVEGGGLQLEDLEALAIEPLADWLAFHAAPHRQQQYRAVNDIVQERDQFRGPTETGDVQTAVSSKAEACGVVRRVCGALGLTGSLMTGEDGTVTIADLATPSEALADAIQEINGHALRVFDDSNGARRNKALEKGHTVRKAIGTLGVALRYVGAELQPFYRTERDRAKQNNVMGDALKWTRLNDDAPEPRPRHPVLQR